MVVGVLWTVTTHDLIGLNFILKYWVLFNLTIGDKTVYLTVELYPLALQDLLAACYIHSLALVTMTTRKLNFLIWHWTIFTQSRQYRKSSLFHLRRP